MRLHDWVNERTVFLCFSEGQLKVQNVVDVAGLLAASHLAILIDGMNLTFLHFRSQTSF